MIELQCKPYLMEINAFAIQKLYDMGLQKTLITRGDTKFQAQTSLFVSGEKLVCFVSISDALGAKCCSGWIDLYTNRHFDLLLLDEESDHVGKYQGVKPKSDLKRLIRKCLKKNLHTSLNCVFTT